MNGAKMKDFLKKYSGLLYIAVMTAVVAVVLGCTDELDQIAGAVKALRPAWIWAAGGCIAAYLFLRMATLKFYLSRRGYRLTWRQAAGVTGAGQFYSAITPSASGGQPMQVFWLRRFGIPVSEGTACVMVKFMGFQTAILSSGAALALMHWGMVGRQLYGFGWLIALGFVINAGLVTAVLLTIRRSGMLDGLVRWVLRIGAKLRIVRRPEGIFEKFSRMIGEYRDALKQLLKKPLDALIVLGLSVAQTVSYMAVAVCLYRAFGLSGTKAGEIMTLQFLLFIAAAFIPLPGAAGAQESGFCMFFRGVFPDAGLTAAMVMWRFFSYYTLLFAGLAMMLAAKMDGNFFKKMLKKY